MQTGKQTLRSIEQGIVRLRQDVDGLDQQLSASSDTLVNLRQSNAARFRRMAEIRLDSVISGEVSDSLTRVDAMARDLMQQRKQKRADLIARIESLEAERSQAEQQREAAAAETGAATERLDAAEAAVQQRLENDPAYMAQLEATRAAEARAGRSREKTGQAAATRKEKGVPYETDPLFMYLWKRGYGSSDYRAWPLTRWLDGWVAGLCHYEQARRDYAALLKIPERLGAHADRLEQAADEEFIALVKLETAAAEVDGVPQLQQAVADAQAVLDGLDQQIGALEEQVHAHTTEKSSFARGEDTDFRRAVDLLTDALQGERLLTLYDYARATATAEDDMLVHEMEDARDELRAAGEEVDDQLRMRDRVEDRLRELESIRQRFKRSRYDSVHSQFRDDGRLDSALVQFIAGAATAGELWKALERSQRYRRIKSDPSFGSGGFQPRPGSWHTPFPTGGPLDWGRSSRRSPGRFPGGGGGFRTGGGF